MAAFTKVLPENCAVNIWGWGIQIPDCVDRNNITVLTADHPAKKIGDFSQVYAEHAKHGPPGRMPFYFTARELRGDSARSYIFVGFALPLLEKKYRQLAPSHQGAGRTVDNESMTLVPGIASDALVMVVAAVADAPQRATLYALLDTPPGLCVPYLTSFEYWYVQIRAAYSFAGSSWASGPAPETFPIIPIDRHCWTVSISPCSEPKSEKRST
jgi:hypothetical protein